jgi:cytoskeletal protein CcmA (bactofilin family)
VRRLFRCLVAGCSLGVCCSLSAPALGADLLHGPEVTVSAGQTISDDVYVAGRTVVVSGTVDGSVIAAGGNVTIAGTITHDLTVASGNVVVSGRVDGSVRAAGGTVTISGPVGGDVVAAGGTVDVTAKVGRDAVVAGRTVTLGGGIGRRVLASAGNLDLRGPVSGDVEANVDRLWLDGGAAIGGNLTYASDNAAALAPGAKVHGIIRHNSPLTGYPTGGRRVAFGLLGWLRAVVGFFVLGLVAIRLFPTISRVTVDAIRTAPWPCLGLGGVALLASVPFAALLVFLIGLWIGGWWLALFISALYGIALATGYVLAAFFVGHHGATLFGRGALHPLLELLAGVVMLTLVGFIPVLGALVTLTAIVFGLGGLGFALWQNRTRPGALVATS